MGFFRVIGGLVRVLLALLVLAAMILKLTLPSPQQRWQQQQTEWQQSRESLQQYQRQRDDENLRQLQERQRQEEREVMRRLAEELQRGLQNTPATPSEADPAAR
jgi:flagellar biosynthesis/type III secretory pathway M-ring protein FliF/YscJ